MRPIGTRDDSVSLGKRSAWAAVTSVTSPTTTPFGYAPPMPKVSKTSPLTGTLSFAPKSRLRLPSPEPRPTPSPLVRLQLTSHTTPAYGQLPTHERDPDH